MKLAASVIFGSLAGTHAFTSTSHRSTPVALHMVDWVDEESPVVSSDPTAIDASSGFKSATTTTTSNQMSQSLPFMIRPAALDGTMVGDVGFDPLGFAKSKEDLLNYREAEIKHARLAMLAAAGWPVSELLDRKIATFIGAPPIVDATDRAPSLLNGGLGKISPLYWVICLLAAGTIDYYGILRSKGNDPNYFPGNLGFDPLGLYPKDKAGQERMQLAELKNGRLGMIAITAFAVQEFVSRLGVIDETPIFFKPIGGVLHDYANSGYYQ